MDFQLITALFLGFIALFYVGKKFIKQFTQTEKDPKCGNCPVPDEKLKIKNEKWKINLHESYGWKVTNPQYLESNTPNFNFLFSNFIFQS